MKGMKGIKENNKPFIDQVADFYISTADEAHPQVSSPKKNENLVSY